MIKRVLTIMLILFLGTGAGTFARVVGNWSNTVRLQPPIDSITGSSTLIAGYFEGALAESPSRALSRLFLTDPSFTQLGSALQIVLQMPFMQGDLNRSVFHLEGYHKQEIIFDWPVGTLGLRFDLALSLGEPSLQYLWKETFVSYGGISFTGRFSLMPIAEGFGSGMGLRLRGTTFGGAGVELNSIFGMTTEIEEIQEGTGPETYPSFTQWKSTELSLTGLVLDWLHFDNTTRISRGNAFEYTKFDFQLEPKDWPVSFDLTAKFAPQTQSVRIKSTVDLEELGLPVEAVLYIYSRGFEVRGFSLPYVEVNDTTTLSSIVAVKGSLYKKRRAGDIDLRATNYYIDAALEDLKGYEKTDYVAVFSLEGSFGTADLGINFASDVRFKKEDGGQSLELGLLTGEINYDVGLSKQLAFGGGIAIDPATGLQELVLNLETWFFWY